MKKLFTLIALLTVFLGAKADELVDAFVDFSTVTEIPRFGWGGSESAFARLSLQDGCLHFASTEATDPTWDCQWFPIGGVDAEVGVTYTLHYKVKGDHNENISMLGFGQTPYGQFPITTEWVEGTIDYECTSADGNMLCQAGGYVGTFDIAYLKITHEGKAPRPTEWIELLTNGDAEQSWEDLGLAGTKADDVENNYKVCIWAKERDNHPADDGGFDTFPAHIIADPDDASNHIFWFETPAATTEGDAAAWDSQLWLESPRQWKTGEQFRLSFRYKADTNVNVATQYHKQNPGDYLHWQAIGDIAFTTEWQTFEQVVTVPSDANGAWSIAFNLNQNNHDPMNFYIDDLSWSQMKLEEGLFIAAANKETALDYDFDFATEFVYDEEEDALKATVGTAGDQDSWVNEVMISTVRGNDRQFKANTYKLKGTLIVDEWVDYEEGASAVIKLPAAGVWNVYVDQNAVVMMFEQVEGDLPKDPLNPEECINPTEIVVYAVERDYKSSEVEGGTGQDWDNQFFLVGNRALAVGEEVFISFDYMAETAASVGTQNSQDQGGYLHWAGLGTLEFTTEWQHFENTVAIPSETSGNQNSWTFNMALMKEANAYHIKNIRFMTADNMENLINVEGTENFWIKTGADTKPYQAMAFDPENPTGINNVVNTTANGAVYNLAGQRISENFKGIVVKNGQKFIVK